MEQENASYGLIYVLQNQYMPGIVKIGKTKSHDVAKRMKELYTTGVPHPFECVFAYKIEESRLDAIEYGLHNLFCDSRVSPNREFFMISPTKVEIALKTIGNFELATKDVQIEIDKVTDADEKKMKRPRMDFEKMGLPIGTTLYFKKDHSITCIITSNKKVIYQGKKLSLSSFTYKLLNYKSQVQPSPYWETVDGISLTSLYLKSMQILANHSDIKLSDVVTEASQIY
ncbi:MAG: GIY-YIG nuclease family protein [Bacteroides sp.]|nr:GIY-YIG nuclease family protein [Bacteroidales bacterium]MCM1353354.1 GIY-YIG nuclease family protein [Bacteroides sp.]MCM1442238.1 GIY-YIG nuclease family protein [Muribaculum sp.]